MAETEYEKNIEHKIIMLRNKQVMLDRDLAELYGVETRRLNEQVKRNAERFPEEFYFQLTKDEYESLKSHFATSNTVLVPKERLISQIVISNTSRGGVRKLPYAFTEQGVAMLSGILRSETAIKVSVQIMNTFVAMRKFLLANAALFQRLDAVERHQLAADKRIDELFTKMERHEIDDKQGIFFQGQIFDAYAFFQNLIQHAEQEIILIDGYVDLSVLERFTQKKQTVHVVIYTKQNPKIKSALTELDIAQFNTQYPTLTVQYTTKMHDRFLILDKKEIYHIGASLKDLGKTCFAFSKLADAQALIPAILKNISA